jgi:hypothetical protein
MLTLLRQQPRQQEAHQLVFLVVIEFIHGLAVAPSQFKGIFWLTLLYLMKTASSHKLLWLNKM